MTTNKSSTTAHTTTVDQILGNYDVGGLVLEHLSPAELVKLAEVQPSLLPQIKALEARWLRGCVELCGGTLPWLDTMDGARARLESGCGNGWMEAWRTLDALRTEYLTSTLPKLAAAHLPEVLPWGDEQWSRLHDLPQEAALRDAFARCALYHPSVVDGCGDEQCDTYPVGAAFYRRTALSDLSSMDEGAIEEAILKMRGAFHQAGYEDFVNDAEEAIMKPISVSALLANLPSPVYMNTRDCLRGMACRRIERAIFDAAASCGPFVALCMGETPALTPAQALEVLCGTWDATVSKGIESDCCDHLPIGTKGEYDDEEGMAHDGPWEYISRLGIDQVEHALKAQLGAVAAKHGIEHAGLTAAATADATLGLQWDDGMAGAANVANATNAALAAHKEELATLIEAQLRAVAGDALSLEEAYVTPVMLTSSDAMSRYWSGAKNGDNDHEGVQAMAFVSEAWVLLVAGKCASC